MKIAICTMYPNQANDQMFCEDSCNIGENLLLPNILLKQKLEAMGHELHTIDMYQPEQIDAVIFQEVPLDSLLILDSPLAFVKYVLKRKWRKDHLLKMVRKLPKSCRVLLIMEPPVVAPRSYERKNHRYFGSVLTWDDTLADTPPYRKYFCPQYVPLEKYEVPFSQKKQFVIISGNKQSSHTNELYSARKQVIEFFENKPGEFDLYGFGWEIENYRNYRGTVDRKLKKLSEYKFCVCYENMRDVEGYITEKIFDCFFAGCVPIYWGANNITSFVPENTFIDMRQFATIEQMYSFVSKITKEEYDEYLQNIRQYLKSEAFRETFSVENYINIMIDTII